MRKIIHIDMDCFFAAVEVRDNPELKGKAVAVGGSSQRRGVISAANYEARKFGVRSALSTALALRKCPQLILVKPDMKKYVEVSKVIQSIFRKYTEVVEPLSLDEAFLDVSDCNYFQGSASLLAAEIRKEIFEATGLTASAGIAANKFLAKVASDWNKPNGQFVIPPGDVEKFVEKLAIEKIFGVGKVTAKKMHGLGIKTCEDLQKLSLTELERNFGSFGHSLYEICRGVDNRKVITSRMRKSLSIERTFHEDLSTPEECISILPELFEMFQSRFQKRVNSKNETDKEENPDQIQNPVEDIKTLLVKVKFSDFTSTTVEGSFDSITPENFTTLLKRGLERKAIPVRLIGLGVKFKSKSKPKQRENKRQLQLFDVVAMQ